MLKEEFKLGMHNSLSEIIRKIDIIMSGSLKRAHGGDTSQEPIMQEKIMKKILNTINQAHNKQVGRIIKTERESRAGDASMSSDMKDEYEAKIKMMAEQIAKLT